MLPAQPPAAPALGGSRWNTFPATGSMTARAFFTGVEPLLQGTVDALRHPDFDVLRAQIHATLGLGTRETSLPLAIGPESASAARELGAQAESIGGELASWTAEALDRLRTRRTPPPAGPLVVRSHCYGHLLTRPAARLLLDQAGDTVAMQLYNEWLHQIVLLRDALLPFADWREVPLLVTPAGLRHTEQARDRFLTELLVRRIRHSSIVDFARHVVTGAPGPAGYGFDTDGGTVLPAVVAGPPRTAPRHLLTWRPDPAAAGTAAYVAELRDYYAAPRTPAEQLPPAIAAPGPLTARVVTGPALDGTRTARIEVTHNGTTARVDLGQALRGHRFAHRRTTAADAPAADGTVDPWAVLRAPGLVSARGGGLTVDATGQDDLVVLALLGRLYPDHVVLRSPGPDAPDGPDGLFIEARAQDDTNRPTDPPPTR
ncbi:hypothetical protein ACQEV4_20905 [Streptomyces shenzhenensis]|uniref:hypothetical protein n=1 Tax=Streptomyces shenzhenensis TaxID=943815 RepID=UPI003D8DAD28